MIEQEFIDIPDMILLLKMKDRRECVDIFNISALAGILLKSENVYLFFFSTIFRTI